MTDTHKAKLRDLLADYFDENDTIVTVKLINVKTPDTESDRVPRRTLLVDCLLTASEFLIRFSMADSDLQYLHYYRGTTDRNRGASQSDQTSFKFCGP